MLLTQHKINDNVFQWDKMATMCSLRCQDGWEIYQQRKCLITTRSNSVQSGNKLWNINLRKSKYCYNDALSLRKSVRGMKTTLTGHVVPKSNGRERDHHEIEWFEHGPLLHVHKHRGRNDHKGHTTNQHEDDGGKDHKPCLTNFSVLERRRGNWKSLPHI